jgi:hypothetical protein
MDAEAVREWRATLERLRAFCSRFCLPRYSIVRGCGGDGELDQDAQVLHHDDQLPVVLRLRVSRLWNRRASVFAPSTSRAISSPNSAFTSSERDARVLDTSWSSAAPSVASSIEAREDPRAPTGGR